MEHDKFLLHIYIFLSRSDDTFSFAVSAKEKVCVSLCVSVAKEKN